MNRKGFTPLIVIGIVAVIVIIGTIGYFAWKNSTGLQPASHIQQNLPPQPSANVPAVVSSTVTYPIPNSQLGPNFNSTTTITLQTKTVGGFTYALTETCDDLEQSICYDDVVQLIKSATSSPRTVLFSTSTPAIANPSFDVSPLGDFATIDFTYAGSDMIDNISTQDSFIIVGTQQSFLKSFSDVELTTPKILNEAKGQQGYELALGNPDLLAGCVGHPLTWSSNESSVTGEICLWNTEVNPAPEVIDSNLFTINTADWSVQAN